MSSYLKTIATVLITIVLFSCASTKSNSTPLNGLVEYETIQNVIGDTLVFDSNIIQMSKEVPLFDFNTSTIEKYEGCTDSLVYPGGGSGPTIACGLDLGNIGSKNADQILEGVVSDSIKAILMKGTTKRGKASIEWIRRNQVHLGKHTSIMLCNSVKRYVWKLTVGAYPKIQNAPPSVKEAVLSAAFCTGVGSKRLKPIAKAIESENWNLVANTIEVMHLDFKGGKWNSIHNRRVNEAIAIRVELNPPKQYEIDYD